MRLTARTVGLALGSLAAAALALGAIVVLAGGAICSPEGCPGGLDALFGAGDDADVEFQAAYGAGLLVLAAVLAGSVWTRRLAPVLGVALLLGAGVWVGPASLGSLALPGLAVLGLALPFLVLAHWRQSVWPEPERRGS